MFLLWNISVKGSAAQSASILGFHLLWYRLSKLEISKKALILLTDGVSGKKRKCESKKCIVRDIHITVTQIYVSTIYFILKQGYMFRLEVSHLQAPTTFSLPDALPALGSYSVYICGIHFSLNFLKRIFRKFKLKCIPKL